MHTSHAIVQEVLVSQDAYIKTLASNPAIVSPWPSTSDRKSGGAILLKRKYFYGKKLKSYGAPLK